MDFYEFVDLCRDQGMTAEEAENECFEVFEETRQRRIREYENDPEVQYGWYQQDMIDSWRNER